jgi:hypothetical protein
MRCVTVVGDPRRQSRTLTVAVQAAGAITEAASLADRREVIDRVELGATVPTPGLAVHGPDIGALPPVLRPGPPG